MRRTISILLALLLLGSGCSEWHLFGRGDPVETGLEDTGQPQACWENSLRLEDGDFMSPAEEDVVLWMAGPMQGMGSPSLWVDTCSYPRSTSHEIFLLDQWMTEYPAGDQPIFEYRPSSVDGSRRWDLDLAEGYEGEGIFFVGYAEYPELLFFDSVPSTTTQVTDAPIHVPYPGDVVMGDLDGDGLDDLLRWVASSDGFAHLSPLPSLVSDEDADLAWPEEEGTVVLVLETGSGESASIIQDLDGDGYSDLAAWAYRDGDPVLEVWLGPYEGWDLFHSGDLELSFSEELPTVGVGGFDEQPGAVVPVGDLTGDGQADLALPLHLASDDQDPAVWILDSLEPGSFTSDQVGFGITSPRWTESHRGTQPYAVGDANGDGQVDLLLLDVTGQDEESAHVHLVPGPVDSALTLPDGAVSGVFPTGWTDDYNYFHVTPTGDLDGDGMDDFVYGHYSHSTSGHNGGAWLFRGCESW